MAEKQENFDQLRYLHDVYAREYETLLGEIQNYVMISSSFGRSKEVLSKVDSFNDSNLLLSIEAGAFVRVNAKDFKSLIVQVGYGYLVEKNIDEAKEYISKNAEKVENNLKQLVQQRVAVEKELIDITYKLEAMQQA